MFYGRQEDLRWIDERLTQPGNEMILLYGQRRIGKTSLLHQIRNQRDSGSILPVFVDTHGLAADAERRRRLVYAGLVRTISRELLVALGDVPGDGQTAEHLLAMIHSLNLQFPTRTLVLLFDEVDALGHEDTRRDAVVRGRRRFSGRCSRATAAMSIIATGSADGSRLGGPFWSVLAPKSIARRIGLLSRGGRACGSSAIRSVAEIEFEEGVPETHSSLDRRAPVLHADVLPAARRCAERASHTPCIAGRRERTCHRAIARRATAAARRHVERQHAAAVLGDGGAGAAAVGPRLRGQRRRLLVASQHAPTTVVAELRRLTVSEILEEASGHYRFSVDFMRLWIRRAQLWWSVAQPRRHSG